MATGHLFPAGLYGKARETQRYWKVVARRAWEQGSWRQALRDEPHRPYAAEDGPLVIQNLAGDLVTRQPNWHLHWAKEHWRAYDVDPKTDWRKEHRLALEALEEFWFALACAAGLRAYWNFLYGMPKAYGTLDRTTARGRDEIFRPMLERYLAWLPEMVPFEPLLAQAALAMGIIPLWGNHFENIWKLTDLCYPGFIPPQTTSESEKPKTADFLRRLEQCGVARLVEGRYELVQ